MLWKFHWINYSIARAETRSGGFPPSRAMLQLPDQPVGARSHLGSPEPHNRSWVFFPKICWNPAKSPTPGQCEFDPQLKEAISSSFPTLPKRVFY